MTDGPAAEVPDALVNVVIDNEPVEITPAVGPAPSGLPQTTVAVVPVGRVTLVEVVLLAWVDTGGDPPFKENGPFRQLKESISSLRLKGATFGLPPPPPPCRTICC